MSRDLWIVRLVNEHLQLAGMHESLTPVGYLFSTIQEAERQGILTIHQFDEEAFTCVLTEGFCAPLDKDDVESFPVWR